MSRQYYMVTNLSMVNGQWNALKINLQLLSDNAHSNPSRRNHWRNSLAGTQSIFEGLFDDTDWSVEGMQSRLTGILGGGPLITSETIGTAYGTDVTYLRSGTPRMRMTAFGALLTDYGTSHAAVLQYIIDNIAEWDPGL